jgi:hypothetical protein
MIAHIDGRRRLECKQDSGVGGPGERVELSEGMSG